MWKMANPPTSGVQNSQRSSSGTTTVPSTARTSPQKPPSTPPTPFLRSRSEVRFALGSNFGLDSEAEKRVPPSLPIQPAIAQPPNTPTNNIHLSPNPNQCYRLAPRQIQLPAYPGQCEDGKSIPLRGQYVAISDVDRDEIDTEDPDDPDDDLPPGLDDDLQTAMRKFAWAYAKGLGGLVMGVVDGFARVAGGDGGGTR